MLEITPPSGVEDSEESRCVAMTRHEAALEIAKHHARQIIGSIVSPYDGAKSLVWEACHPLSTYPHELEVFVALESEYADFSDDTRRDYYGEEHCAKTRAKLANRSVEEARRLLDLVR